MTAWLLPWLTAGVWVAIVLLVIDGVTLAVSVVGRSRQHADTADGQAALQQQIDGLHARLDAMGAPGVHPDSPPAGQRTYTPTITEPPTVVLTAADRPTLAQQEQPTRPDFTVQPPAPADAARYGRHAAGAH